MESSAIFASMAKAQSVKDFKYGITRSRKYELLVVPRLITASPVRTCNKNLTESGDATIIQTHITLKKGIYIAKSMIYDDNNNNNK